MSQRLSFKVKNAAFGFKKTRATFYLDLASVMEASPGEAVTKILARYAERYKQQTIGILCRHWLDRFAHVGTFTESLRGTIPTEDLATLAAAEASGDLRLGLEKLGKNILAMNQCNNEIVKSLFSALVLVTVWHIFIGMESFMVLPKLEAAMKGKVDTNELGKIAVVMFGGAGIVRTFWPLWVLMLIGLIGAVMWGTKRYVGRGRKWLDDHVLPFQMARDFNSAAFFSTMGSITTRRAGHVVQLHEALAQLRQNAYPWLGWQIGMIMENLAARPNSKGEIFNTGITNQRSYYRILDISDYAEVPEMLQKTSDALLKSTPDEIKSRANKVKIILMAVCMVSMLGVYGGTFVLIEAFKTAAQMKALH